LPEAQDAHVHFSRWWFSSRTSNKSSNGSLNVSWRLPRARSIGKLANPGLNSTIFKNCGAPVTAFRSSNGQPFQKRRRYAYGGYNTHPGGDLIGD
jgi:hypothetical protein